MASEWEELEKQPKEDLIIQLVLWKNLFANMRERFESEDCPWYPAERKWTGDEPGEHTTREWAEKIALYGAMHPKDQAFYSSDLMDYGLTADQADETCRKLRAEGRLKMPEGIDYYDSETEVPEEESE